MKWRLVEALLVWNIPTLVGPRVIRIGASPIGQRRPPRNHQLPDLRLPCPPSRPRNDWIVTARPFVMTTYSIQKLEITLVVSVSTSCGSTRIIPNCKLARKLLSSTIHRNADSVPVVCLASLPPVLPPRLPLWHLPRLGTAGVKSARKKCWMAWRARIHVVTA